MSYKNRPGNRQIGHQTINQIKQTGRYRTKLIKNRQSKRHTQTRQSIFTNRLNNRTTKIEQKYIFKNMLDY